MYNLLQIYESASSLNIIYVDTMNDILDAHMKFYALTPNHFNNQIKTNVDIPSRVNVIITIKKRK